MRKIEESPLALCGAKSKRTGLPCRQPAMKNGRCRLHGGKSTGAKTEKGIQAIRNANIKHGLYSKKYLVEKARISNLLLTRKHKILSIPTRCKHKNQG